METDVSVNFKMQSIPRVRDYISDSIRQVSSISNGLKEK